MNEKTLFERMVLESYTPGARLIRFCLGDEFPININKVLIGDGHPVGYGQEIINQRLTDSFITKGLNEAALPEKTPGWIRQLYVYEEATAASLILRLTALFADRPDRFNEEFLLGQLYLLTMTDTKYPISIAGGLASFGSIGLMLTKHNPKAYHRTEGIFFSKMVKLLSRIDHPNWFMHQKSWQSLWNEPRLMKTFRHFLHAAAVSFWITDQQIEEFHDLSREDLTLFMHDLIPLLEHSTTTAKDVRDFTKRLHFYFNESLSNSGYEILLKRPFYWSEMFFGECNENLQLFYHLLHSQNHTVPA